MSDILDKLTINTQVLGFMIVNFVILVIALRFILLKPLAKAIKERQDNIQKGLNNAKLMDDKVKKFERDYTAKIADVQKEADQMIAETKIDAQKIREEHLQKARHDATEILAKAQKDIEKLKQDLRKDAISEIGQIVEKVVSELVIGELTEKQKIQIIDKAISSLENIKNNEK